MKKTQPTRDDHGLPGPGCLMTRRQITDFLHPRVKRTAVEKERNRIDQRVRQAIDKKKLTPIETKPELVYRYEDVFRWAVHEIFWADPKGWNPDWWRNLPAGVGRQAEYVDCDTAHFQEPKPDEIYIPAAPEQREQLLRELQEERNHAARQSPKRGRPRQ